VVDNATEQDGKEFFTIETPDENTFYLIIDRQRDSGGVYLLDAVTERDLLALAEKGGKDDPPAVTDTPAAVTEPVPAPAPAVVPAPESEPEPDPEPDRYPEPEPEPKPEPEPDPVQEPEPAVPANNMGSIIFIVLAVIAAGGAGYYFKILKPRRDAALAGDGEDDGDELDDEDIYGDYPDDLPEREDETPGSEDEKDGGEDA
jgi:hypothetical protein